MFKKIRLFQAIFALIGLLFAVFGTMSYQRYAGHESWMEVPVDITHAELRVTRDNDGKVTYEARVEHQYVVDGRAYVGSRFYSHPNEADAMDTVNAFNNGGRTYSLRVDPDNPDVTTGESNPQLMGLLFAGFGGLFVLIAIGFFFIKTEEDGWVITRGNLDDDPLDRTSSMHD